MKNKSVKIDDIKIDGGTQQRESIDLAIVSEYAEAMRCGAKFPPVVAFFDGAQYWLADGFHRFHASKEAEFIDMLCDVHDGTNRDAKWYSLGANGGHGLRPTNADKRKSVMVALTDSEWSQLSDRDIAKQCKVSNVLVSKIRTEVNFGIRKEDRVLTVNTLTPEAAPVANVAFQESDENPQQDDDQKNIWIESLKAQEDQIQELISRQAVSVMDIPESQRIDINETISGLRSRVKSLEISLDAVTASRDSYMVEISELKKQCAWQQRELKKYKSE